MKKIKTKIAVFAFSLVSFLGIQSASAIENFAVGLGMQYHGFYATGEESSSSSGDGVRTITREDGAFDADSPAIFIEAAVNDSVTFGIEYIASDITTPTNTNLQAETNYSGSGVTNTVKASFEDHTTFYANINMPFNTYLKLGYHMVDVATQENLGTGGAYNDVDTTGYAVGLGYNHNVDNGVFIRAEVSVSSYEDVDAANVNETDKKIKVFDMYGATAQIKVGKSF